MKRPSAKLKISVEFVERAVDLPNFSGFIQVIETICECLDGQNSEEAAYPYLVYLVHWRIDEEDNLKRYAHQVQKENGQLDPLGSIPYEIYQKMKGRALSFFRVERAKDSVKSLHEYVIEPDPQDRSKVYFRFKRREWSAYRFAFRQRSNGEIEAIQTANNTVLTGERARDGHRRPPTEASNAAYDFVLEHFAGSLHSDNHKQCEIDLTPQDAPK